MSVMVSLSPGRDLEQDLTWTKVRYNSGATMTYHLVFQLIWDFLLLVNQYFCTDRLLSMGGLSCHVQRFARSA
jgi:hypothetical protein